MQSLLRSRGDQYSLSITKIASTVKRVIYGVELRMIQFRKTSSCPYFLCCRFTQGDLKLYSIALNNAYRFHFRPDNRIQVAYSFIPGLLLAEECCWFSIISGFTFLMWWTLLARTNSGHHPDGPATYTSSNRCCLHTINTKNSSAKNNNSSLIISL
jgi:hypothetical protein